MDNELKTEELIFNAAKEVFLEKGFDGARMQEIAERAGINKALLHYYYRSKDKLFDMIFAQVIKQIFKQIESVWVSDISFEDKIRHFVSNYITLIVKNPYIPRFIINTINSYPDKFEQIIEEKSAGTF
jgi:AcrR family transcriptional regulator